MVYHKLKWTKNPVKYEKTEFENGFSIKRYFYKVPKLCFYINKTMKYKFIICGIFKYHHRIQIIILIIHSKLHTVVKTSIFLYTLKNNHLNHPKQ